MNPYLALWLLVSCGCGVIGGCVLRPVVQDSRTDARQRHLTELEQIELDGIEAAKKGIPVEACPYDREYPSQKRNEYWKRGWIKGKIESAK